MSAPREPRRRLFFALWPTAAMQESLLAAASAATGSLASGRPVPRENLHQTVAFLGSVPESSLAKVEAIARSFPRPPALGAPLALTFDRLEYWARAELLCAAAHPSPSAAGALAEALKQALLAAGFAPDLKPFRPHVTLARQVKRRPRECALAEVTWTFSEFALVESRSGPAGSLYSVVASWPLDEG
jgi:RNA 2',3'-cyclic 3'-phosphodiesterase